MSADMYVVNLKWCKKNAVAVVIIAALVLALIVFLVARGGGEKAVQNGNIRTNEDRVAYLKSLGWECDPECVAQKTTVIPREFDEVYSQYNEIQLVQGFDLSNYCGMEVTLYAYRVLNFEDDSGTVFIQLVMCGSEVIAGDIHSASVDGFMLPMKSEAVKGQ